MEKGKTKMSPNSSKTNPEKKQSATQPSDSNTAAQAANAEKVAQAAQKALPKIVWKDDNMQSLYSNVANVIGGREEIVMLLGMNQSWKPNAKQVEVNIAERVVMSPYAAKRLAMLLNGTLAAYEKHYGTIDIGIKTQSAPSKK